MSYSDDTSEKMLLNQMEVDRKLRDDLRWDSLKLSWEFYKLLYCESQAHKAFIPRRFEDLKFNGGIRLRRIPIKLIYHKAKFKKRKRWLIRENRDPSVSQKLEISTNSLRLGVKSVGMKNQYHRKKRTTQVKLAQACKSLGMFVDSPSFRNPKDYMMIRLDKKQISDTGVKRETHLFVYGLTFLALMKIDCHVDTWIGDQGIFAEEVKALGHDDPDDAMKSVLMESLKDETVMKSEPERMSKYKSQVELSHFQQQKEQRRFHKVRFKGRRHRRAPYTGRVVLQKKVSHKTRKKVRKIVVLLTRHGPSSFRLTRSVKDAKVLAFDPGGANRENAQELVFDMVGFVLEMEGKTDQALLFHNPGEAKQFWQWRGDHTELILELFASNGINTVIFLMGVKKRSSRKIVCAQRFPELSLANQVWKPGGDGDDSSLCLSMLFGNCKEVSDNDGGKETDLKRWLNCSEELDPSRVLFDWDPGQAKAAKKRLELLKSPHSKKKLVNGVEAETLGQEHDSGGSFSGLVLEVCAPDTGGKRGVGALEMLTLDPGGLAGLRNGSDIKFSSRNAETMWNGEGSCERVIVSIMNKKDQDKLLQGRFEFDILVKCCVLGATRLLGSQQTISSWEVEITDSSVGLWTLEDKAVILPGSTLKFYGGKIMKLFLSAEKKIIEEAADCQEVNSQDLENVLMTFILASHSPSGGNQNLRRESTQDLQAVLTQYNWYWCWIVVVHNVLLCLCVSALCYHLNLTGQELEEDNKTQGPVTLRHCAHDIDSNIQWHSTCGDVSQLPVVVYTSEKQTSSWFHGSVTDGDGDPSGRSCEKISGVSVKLAMQMGHNHNKFLLQLNYQDSLSKEGRVSYVYSNSGMSDALLNHKMDTPTSEKLQGTEEMMGFEFYDWFQSPRPPELSKTGILVSLLYISALVTGWIENQGKGALVVTASKVRQLEDNLAPVLHQLEDKLVLHRGSIDKHTDGPLVGLGRRGIK